MTRDKRRLYWVVGAVVALVAAAGAAALLAETLLNRPETVRRLSDLASRQVGGRIHFQRVSLSLLPLRVTLHGIRGYLHGQIGATVEAASVYPSLRGLLTGRLPIGAVHIDTPRIYATLPRGAKTPVAQKPAPSPAVQIAGAAAALAERLPALTVAIDGGEVALSGNETLPDMVFDKLRVRLSVPDAQLTVGCGSAAWKRLRVSLQVDRSTLQTGGDITVDGLDLAELHRRLPGGMPLAPGATQANLHARFSATKTRIDTATATLSLPTLAMTLPEGRLSLDGLQLSGDYTAGGQVHTINITSLRLAAPAVSARGRMTIGPAGTPGRYRIEAAADTIDLGGVRSTLDAAIGRDPVVATVLDIVRGGSATDATFKVTADTPAGLGDFSAMTIAGWVTKTDVHIPDIALSLTDGSGRFLIRDGTLHCLGASARTGQSRGTNGALKLGLLPNDDAFELSVEVDARLEDLPGALTGILPPEDRQWLESVTAVGGAATGLLKLGPRLANLEVQVDVASVTGDATIDGLPHPVAVSSGKARITDKTVSVEDVNGAMGRSSASDIAASLDFASGLVEVHAAGGTLDASEIFEWVTRLPEHAALRAVVGTVNGTAELEDVSWRGSVMRPGDGDVALTLSTGGVTLAGGQLPAPMTVDCQKAVIAADRVSVPAATLRMKDTLLTLSGNVYGDKKGLDHVDARVSGSVGATVFQRLADGGVLPPQLIIRPPLSVTDLSLSWQRANGLNVEGALRMGEGPQITLDASLAQETVDIRRFRIQDSASDATVSFRYRKMGVSASFSGRLMGSTVDQLLVSNTLLFGAVKGSASVRWPLGRITDLAAEGRLTASEVYLPDWEGKPLQIHSLDIRSQGRQQIMVKRIDMHMLGSRIGASGKVGLSEDTFQAALDVAVDHVDVHQWAAALEPGTKDDAPAAPSRGKRAPKRQLDVSLNIDAGNITAGRLAWAPVAAVVTLSPKGIEMVFSKAKVCGISHPGSVALTKDTITAAFTPAATGQDLNATLNCLNEKPVDVTGTFDLSGSISASGPRGDIASILSGDITVGTSSGTIYHAESLEKIFALLNLPGLVGKDFRQKNRTGLGYDVIRADIRIDSGVVNLDRGLMKGPLMQLAFQGSVGITDKAIDVTVFVVPLKSIVNVVSQIPIIGRVISGDLVSIPVKVTGTIDDPSYIPLSPDAVGQKAVRLLHDIIMLPVDIIQPVTPEERERRQRRPTPSKEESRIDQGR